MKVAMLTGGGDCPGLNAVLLADRVGELELVDPDLYHGVAEVFFG